MHDWFEEFTTAAVKWLRHPAVFAGYVAVLLAWLFWGLFVDFSEAWHDVMVTPLTVLTFLYLPLILYAQDKQSATVIAHLKEMAEDIGEVDERKAEERVVEEFE